MDIDERKSREQSFHDKRFGATEARDADKFYSITAGSFSDYFGRLMRNAPNSSVLEYGCGVGSAAFDLATVSGEVHGIDISPIAITLAQERAKQQNLSIDFQTMDAEALSFPAASFDMVCGSGILHHLDLKRAFAEIARVLKPNGTAYFSEPLGHNPVINAYRDRTPDQRTPDEHPLVTADFKLAENYFERVKVSYYHLLTLAAIPVATKPFAQRLALSLDVIDKMLFSVVPALKPFAWLCVIELSIPVNKAQQTAAPRI